MTQAAILAASGSPGTTTGFKNRIINGGMVIDQRNNGASGTASAYTLDRWRYYADQASKGTWQQNAGSVTPPAGFTNYLGFTSSSAYTVGASEQFKFDQAIEGFNCADLGWGTINAKTVTLSFWVRSSLTGTFGGSLANGAFNRTYPFSYTISSANTWTQISITVAGDTTGTWLTTNGIGMYVTFGLGIGSTLSGTAGSWSSSVYVSATGATSVVGTNGATFYLTGVQLEVGTTATNFDFRSITTELQLCQRYLYAIKGSDVQTSGYYAVVATGWTNSTGNGTFAYGNLPVTMRTYPSVVTDGTASHYSWYTPSGLYACNSVPVVNSGNNTPTVFGIAFPISGATASQPGTGLLNGNSTYYIYLSAEM